MNREVALSFEVLDQWCAWPVEQARAGRVGWSQVHTRTAHVELARTLASPNPPCMPRSVDNLRLKAELSHAQEELQRGYADLAYMLGQKRAGADDLFAFEKTQFGVESPRGISKARARILAAKDQLERLSRGPQSWGAAEPLSIQYVPSYYRPTKVRARADASTASTRVWKAATSSRHQDWF
jgi:hypothetical protein